jgi:hypothetical protein
MDNPIITLITPGRRALGEQWSKVSVTWSPDDRAYVLEREDAEAPADGRAIAIPSLGNASPEMINYILGYQMKEAEYRERAEAPTREQRRKETWERVNRMWQDYMEDKLRWLKGQTTIGAGGFNQREKP